MATTVVEGLIISSIRGAFAKYPEGDGTRRDDEWITPSHSIHLARAILVDLSARGYRVTKHS